MQRQNKSQELRNFKNNPDIIIDKNFLMIHENVANIEKQSDTLIDSSRDFFKLGEVMGDTNLIYHGANVLEDIIRATGALAEGNVVYSLESLSNVVNTVHNDAKSHSITSLANIPAPSISSVIVPAITSAERVYEYYNDTLHSNLYEYHEHSPHEGIIKIEDPCAHNNLCSQMFD